MAYRTVKTKQDKNIIVTYLQATSSFRTEALSIQFFETRSLSSKEQHNHTRHTRVLDPCYLLNCSDNTQGPPPLCVRTDQ